MDGPQFTDLIPLSLAQQNIGIFSYNCKELVPVWVTVVANFSSSEFGSVFFFIEVWLASFSGLLTELFSTVGLVFSLADFEVEIGVRIIFSLHFLVEKLVVLGVGTEIPVINLLILGWILEGSVMDLHLDVEGFRISSILFAMLSWLAAVITIAGRYNLFLSFI